MSTPRSALAKLTTDDIVLELIRRRKVELDQFGSWLNDIREELAPLLRSERAQEAAKAFPISPVGSAKEYYGHVPSDSFQAIGEPTAQSGDSDPELMRVVLAATQDGASPVCLAQVDADVGDAIDETQADRGLHLRHADLRESTRALLPDGNELAAQTTEPAPSNNAATRSCGTYRGRVRRCDVMRGEITIAREDGGPMVTHQRPHGVLAAFPLGARVEFVAAPSPSGLWVADHVRKLPQEDAGPLSSDARVTAGRVKWFNEQRGIGFLAPDDGGSEVFCHFSTITGAGFRRLVPGMRVEFDAVRTDKGWSATCVHSSIVEQLAARA